MKEANKTKKSVSKNKMNADLLVKLNKLYKELCKASQELVSEYAKESVNRERIETLDNRATAAKRRFDDLHDALPAVLFDSAKGEYRYATDGHGGYETYTIRVTRISNADFTISAKNPTDAVNEAVRKAKCSGRFADVSFFASNLTQASK